MKSLRRLHLHFPTKSPISKPRLRAPPHSPFSSSSSSSSPNSQTSTLTESEVREINLLIPRLCESNELPTALRLTTTALLANPSLHSLSLSPLIHSLTSQPDLTHTMSLLTHLFHTPLSHPYIHPISLSLLSSYLHNRIPNHALKIFRWLQRPLSPCLPDPAIYEVLIPGLCSNGLLLDALKALGDMLDTHASSVPSSHSKDSVYRALLREARVNQALEFNAALKSLSTDGEGKERVLLLLQRLVAQFTE
ncbi:hypothetical protein VNO77_23544 [Canavalia gladiata]|uniref:Pentatricopeptide repeat-containing protein n=1 Tax=Canavalia gladiata TaxID=3824 RepID=A0AAN9L5Y6_CANGL